MKIKYIFLVYLLGLSNSYLQGSNNFVTWDWGGRTGDQLLSYCIAKWVSHNFNIPLLIKPFKYSNKFVFSHIEEHFTREKVRSLNVKAISHGYKGRIAAFNSDFEEKNTLFNVDLLFAHADWYQFDSIIKKNTVFPYSLEYSASMRNTHCESLRVRFNHMRQLFKNDPNFFLSLKASLQVLEPLETINFPKDVISIAVHVRKGGGFDQPYKSDQFYATTLNIDNYFDCFTNKSKIIENDFLRTIRDTILPLEIVPGCAAIVGYHDLFVPLKHTPDQFYIDQIKVIDALLNLPLFVYIFTDDKHPEEIVARYKKEINSKNITFAYRVEENNHYSNVLNDMFSMAKFDCLIRSGSSFSQVSQLLGNHKLVISPMHAIWDGNKLIIDEVLLEKSDDFNNFINKFKEKK